MARPETSAINIVFNLALRYYYLQLLLLLNDDEKNRSRRIAISTTAN